MEEKEIEAKHCVDDFRLCIIVDVEVGAFRLE